ncbi:MAG: hypothetical protein IKG67_02825 [Parasporobacterium sp.]|nr:hypothetical protein [Parasporobacterium sp.]
MIEITETTKLSTLMQEYPWLVDEAVKMDSRFKVLKSPIGKLFLKNATIGELSEKAGLSAEEIIGQVQSWIGNHA